MRGKDLMDLRQIGGIVDQHQHDGQIARDAKGPEPGLRTGARDDARGAAAQAGIGTQQEPGQRLQIGGFGIGDAEVAQLHLRLCPGQRYGTAKGGWVAVAVDHVEKRGRAVGDHRPKGHAHPSARRHHHAAADGEDRVEHCACGARQGCIGHGGAGQCLPPPDEAGAVGFHLHRRGLFAFDNGDMGGPDLGL